MKREKCQSFPLYLLHVTRVYFLWVSSEGPCLFVALNDKEPPFINSWIRHCTLCSFLYILKHRHILFCYFAEWLNIGTSRNWQNICKTKTVTKLFVRVSARSSVCRSVCSFFCLSVCLFVCAHYWGSIFVTKTTYVHLQNYIEHVFDIGILFR